MCLDLLCSLTKRTAPIICRLCVCVLINKRSFEPFMCLDLLCSLTKRIVRKICRLCVCVLINKRSCEPFLCLDLHWSRFQGFIELFAPWVLQSKVTFAQYIPYKQVISTNNNTLLQHRLEWTNVARSHHVHSGSLSLWANNNNNNNNSNNNNSNKIMPQQWRKLITFFNYYLKKVCISLLKTNLSLSFFSLFFFFSLSLSLLYIYFLITTTTIFDGTENREYVW